MGNLTLNAILPLKLVPTPSSANPLQTFLNSQRPQLVENIQILKRLSSLGILFREVAGNNCVYIKFDL